nr:MAG TPA: hypothetical protein [Caudoviricetes sp.]
MLKELMNHNELGVKFFRDETGKIYVSDELVYNSKAIELEGYQILFEMFHSKEDVEAIKRHIEIAKHYDECMAGTWRPATERKFTRIR